MAHKPDTTTTSPDKPACMPWDSAFSFVKKAKRAGKHGPRTDVDWFCVPEESYADGCITGYRAFAELMAWAEANPQHCDYLFLQVFKAAATKLATPFWLDRDKSKRGAADTVLACMADFMAGAAQTTNYARYCESRIFGIHAYQTSLAEREAQARTGFVERMKQGRAAKQVQKALLASMAKGAANG